MDQPTTGDVRRLDRRLFVRETSRAIGFALLGGGLLAACSDDGDVSVLETTTTTPPTPPESGGSSTTDAGGESTTTAAAQSTDTESPADDVFEWQQVSLGFVSAYVLARGDEVAIVDTGTSGSAGQIGEALSMLGAEWPDVGHVILTHLHGDHVGSLPAILDMAPDATAWAGEADIPGIESPREIAPLRDGDEVFGMTVIHTPGHTAGHISILDPAVGFLVAGDALNEEDSMILGPTERFSADHDQALASVGRLAEREYETVVFGHGNPVLTGASEAVVALAQTL